ncbi:MAG: rRNA maturation RNAse YbeY [Candidatus Liptonbacteria bacterium]|nr:rRNA maturation RNAse YbeY [Candidatus Liptonbacteria bacterium]
MKRTNEVLVWGRGIADARKKKIKDITRRLLREESVRGVHVEIFLLPHKAITALKKRFLPGKKGIANVLAFPDSRNFPHPESRLRYLGEIYLNQTASRGDFKGLIFLLIHGLLHLLGYLHKKKGDIANMEQREKQLWQHISSLV